MRGQWHDVVADYVGEEWLGVLGMIPGLHLTRGTKCPVKQLADAVDLWSIHRLVAVNVNSSICVFGISLIASTTCRVSSVRVRCNEWGVPLLCLKNCCWSAHSSSLALTIAATVSHQSSVMWCKEVIGEVDVELLSKLGKNTDCCIALEVSWSSIREYGNVLHIIEHP